MGGRRSFDAALEFVLLEVFSGRRESFSLELDLLSRLGDFLERLLRLLSEDEDDELLSLERDLERRRLRDLDLDRERLLRRLDLLLLSDFRSSRRFLRRPNSSYSLSDESRSLYSTTSLSL